MFNLRYHIASLVAVFLALAIGLVLGGLVVREGGFDRQQRALVASLQSEYNKLKTDNATLRSSLSLEDAYAKQMTDVWVAGRLRGATVVVVTSGAPSDGANAAVEAIKSAGGSTAVVTIQKPNFALDESTVASTVASVLGTSGVKPTNTVVARRLVAEWSGTSPAHALTDALRTAGVIKVSGLARTTVATSAVDIATIDHDPNPAGLDIAAAYAAAGFRAVGAETRDSQSGVAAAAAARKLSAFDTLGTNAGRYTLVSLLTGGQQGYFSSAAHGVTPFPDVPKP